MIEVKFIFAQDLDFMQKIELVDWIQKLGLSNHFEKEIDEFLQTIFVSAQTINKLSEQENMHVSTLCFRLLRQHGYDVFPSGINLPSFSLPHTHAYVQPHN